MTGNPPPTDDAALLRAFEPVVRFTEGEYFFPVAVDRYVERAALWHDPEDGPPAVVAPPGTLNLEELARHGAAAGRVPQAMSGVVSERHPVVGALSLRHLKDRPPRLRGGNRLAVVGLLGRFVDALNRLSLMFRGSLPGGSAWAAFHLQQDYLEPHRATYYGRVVREQDWIVLQYWYFYAFNNWRSGFGGVNEHEGDWEQVTVYLDGTGALDADGLPAARWVVFSAHDETGDELRRRWDDPDLTVVHGRHPVVHAGAGSHSGWYLAGDYVITFQPVRLTRLIGIIRAVTRLFTPWPADVQGALGIPYVDFARGDGVAIGPGSNRAWQAVVIDDETPWVRDYRGLWGHDTRDRLGGERGPAGPRYNRDGTVRMSWSDPVGWAGMAKVCPNPALEHAALHAQERALAERIATTEGELKRRRQELRVAAAGVVVGSPAWLALNERDQAVVAASRQLTELREERHQLQRLLDDEPGSAEAGKARPGSDPHAHLRHRHRPLQRPAGRRGAFLARWSIVSTPLVLVALADIIAPHSVFSLVTERSDAAWVSVVWLSALLLIEGLARGQFFATIARLGGLGLAGVAAYFAVVDWRIVAAVGLGLAALTLLVVNIRDALRT